MKKIIILACIIVCLIGVIACQASFRWDNGQVKTLMEASSAEWVERVEKECRISGFGRPFGTERETLIEKPGSVKVIFDIDEVITRKLLDGYVKAVWDACVTANEGRLRNSNGYVYDDFSEAEKAQEPLPYYIWYYSVDQVERRVGVYPSNLTKGYGGGIVLEITKKE